MRAVLQRVRHASVTVDGEVIGKITGGLLVLLGIKTSDTEKELDWMVKKVAGLRIFTDENDKMNKSVQDVGGEMLVVSQFTLYGDCVKGRRPGFSDAARPDLAVPLYEKFVEKTKEMGINVETGEFGADMKVELLNDGPVTLVVDSPENIR